MRDYMMQYACADMRTCCYKLKNLCKILLVNMVYNDIYHLYYPTCYNLFFVFM